MDPIVLALSVALGLSLICGVSLAVLYWSERTKHHAAKEWAEQVEKSFSAYKELVAHERNDRVAEKSMELVKPLWDQISS
ncbi:TPA: hypothetical protein ACGW3M_001072 [Pseudomonas aeruginosa]|uniref:hypothetical protein n=1 Tax=Pseudomonas aeruginosa TaxID=287 RepID=UPI0027FEB379|nr:hypothetical protein [Pseudomonas aeruginosa]EKY4113590.1 hypothetical protein [Pseudomonas aeruginosa]ELJ2276112.1 hypothetical protein [Pseudomonas aeruginosa]MBX6653811.1 hypothetical protein [Pseudomonas aeruginosa]MCS8414898.1 hypothetical protein [Pseudomonas aeruginosa]